MLSVVSLSGDVFVFRLKPKNNNVVIIHDNNNHLISTLLRLGYMNNWLFLLVLFIFKVLEILID